MITYLSILLNALRIDRDDERGASAVEYGLLIAGIAALIVVVVFAFGGTISDIFNETCDSVSGNAATCDGPAPAGG
ncbi:Flp family type IVb pilin [Nocardioides kribbensis]|uniref:Flp family type IVb pilin n=1 Tax=Nocardioides kribbensis TaxID=305517 RepID=A0ABV1NVB9_9ACTN